VSLATLEVTTIDHEKNTMERKILLLNKECYTLKENDGQKRTIANSLVVYRTTL
jgi:hypothetical protein